MFKNPGLNVSNLSPSPSPKYPGVKESSWIMRNNQNQDQEITDRDIIRAISLTIK